MQYSARLWIRRRSPANRRVSLGIVRIDNGMLKACAIAHPPEIWRSLPHVHALRPQRCRALPGYVDLQMVDDPVNPSDLLVLRSAARLFLRPTDTTVESIDQPLRQDHSGMM